MSLDCCNTKENLEAILSVRLKNSGLRKMCSTQLLGQGDIPTVKLFSEPSKSVYPCEMYLTADVKSTCPEELVRAALKAEADLIESWRTALDLTKFEARLTLRGESLDNSFQVIPIFQMLNNMSTDKQIGWFFSESISLLLIPKPTTVVMMNTDMVLETLTLDV